MNQRIKKLLGGMLAAAMVAAAFPTAVSAEAPAGFYLADLPRYEEGRAEFTLRHADSGSLGNVRAYVAEYRPDGGLVGVTVDRAADRAGDISDGTLEVSIPCDMDTEDGTVRVYVWDDMVPVPVYRGEKGDPVVVKKSAGGNPILGFDSEGNTLYAGDPAATVVDTDGDGTGDKVYLIAGHDTATFEGYVMPEWVVYTSTDMKQWNYEGVAMKASELSWATDQTSAWASQMIEHNGKYYLYFCTFNRNDSGYAAIGVAVADSPEGPYHDALHAPLVGGSMTPPNTAKHDDIDPTVWIETDENGVEHRYLAWGNTNFYVCELNDDMISVVDRDGNGTITSADITRTTIADAPGTFTEAPWIYRRRDTDGNLAGPYYLFYAMGWREQMAYATTDDLLSGQYQYGGLLMPPTATSNTNHPAVIDFKGKTYFVYHNGSLPWGSGFRRSVCVEELHFREDGSVEPVQETSVGLTGTASYLYQPSGNGQGGFLNYGNFVNSVLDSEYPISKPVFIGGGIMAAEDAQWEILPGKADEGNETYVSLQAVRKPGLYLAADDSGVVLTQDSRQNDTAMKQRMTFRTVVGTGGTPGAVSLESVAKPGYYLANINGTAALTDQAEHAASCDFLISETVPALDHIASIGDAWYENGKVCFYLQNAALYGSVTVEVTEENGDQDGSSGRIPVSVTSLQQRIVVPYTKKSENSALHITVRADQAAGERIVAEKEVTQMETPYPMPEGCTASFAFDQSLENALAEDAPAKKVAEHITGSLSNDEVQYEPEGYRGAALRLTGTGSYGVNLGKVITDSNYSIGFWMNADQFTACTSAVFVNSGSKESENWLSAPFGMLTGGNLAFWSNLTGSSRHHIQSAGGQVAPGTWHQMIVTVDGNHASLYVDGVKTIDNGEILSTVNADTETFLGVNFWDPPFNGMIDEVYVYNGKTLTEKEAKGLYESTVTP